MARKNHYEVGIGADTDGFEKSVRNGLIDPLEDAADKVDDLERSVRDADLERGIDKGQKASKELGDELDDTRDALRKLGYAARDVGDDANHGMKRAEEATTEFKQEALQNLSEVTSSFDGSFESIGDLVQGTLGGVASSIPGIGIAAAGAAAGVGVLTESIAKVEEAANEARDAAFSMAYDVAGALEAAGYSARIEEWTSDTEKFKQVREIATGAGWDEVDVLDALASGGDKLDKLTKAFQDHGGETWIATGRLRELEATLTATGEGYLSGAEAAKLAEQSNYRYAKSVGEATGETDALGNAIYRLPDNTEVVVNAETQKASTDIARFEDTVQALPDKTVKIAAQLDTSQAARDLRNFISGTATKKISGSLISQGRWE